MNYNTLLWGEPDEVREALNHECDEGELRAALQNAFRRIAALEAALAAVTGEGQKANQTAPVIGVDKQ